MFLAWLMMPGAFQASALVSPADALLVDMQHGLIGYRDMVDMVLAAHHSGHPALVRPPLTDFAMVSRALDAGASGVICPMINSADDARKLVSAAKFPPLGARSWGAYLGQSMLGLDKKSYLAEANNLNATFAMIETREALDNVESICAVEGIDGVFVGPNDLCISLTNGNDADFGHRAVQDALPDILAAARGHGKYLGIYTSSPDQIALCHELGFDMMVALTDASLLTGEAKAAADAARKVLHDERG